MSVHHDVYTKYVVGFLFSPKGREVVLIKKLKPKWQRGKLNGVGGKIEPGETPHMAMVREFSEEAGIGGLLWEKFLSYSFQTGQVHFFRAFGDSLGIKSAEVEKCGWYRTDALKSLPIIPNLRWLIPLALDEFKPGGHLIENFAD